MKKVLISTLAVLLLITGCKKIPKLENGKEAVVSLKNGAISVDDLYDEMKSKYALSILIDMIDTQILEEKYDESDDEKDYISSQKNNDQAYYELLYKNAYKTYEQYLQARYGISSASELDELFKLEYRRNQATKDYAKSLVTESQIEDYYKNDYIADIEASHILITADYTDESTKDSTTYTLEERNADRETVEIENS